MKLFVVFDYSFIAILFAGVIGMITGVVIYCKNKRKIGILVMLIGASVSIWAVTSTVYLDAPIGEYVSYAANEWKESFSLQGACKAGNKRKVLRYLKEGESASQIYKGDSLIAVTIAGKGTENEKIEIIKLLMQHGADINWCRTAKDIDDSEGKYNEPEDENVTNLMIAVLYQEVKVTEFLLENGAEADAQDGWGYTAAMYTAHWGIDDEKSMQLLDILVKYNADLEITDDLGQDIEEIARDFVSKEYYEHLLKLLGEET